MSQRSEIWHALSHHNEASHRFSSENTGLGSRPPHHKNPRKKTTKHSQKKGPPKPKPERA